MSRHSEFRMEGLRQSPVGAESGVRFEDRRIGKLR